MLPINPGYLPVVHLYSSLFDINAHVVTKSQLHLQGTLSLSLTLSQISGTLVSSVEYASWIDALMYLYTPRGQPMRSIEQVVLFSPEGRGCVQVWVPEVDCMLCSNIESVLSGWHGAPPSDVKFDFAFWVHKSRLRGPRTFLTFGSESTQSLTRILY